MTPSPQPGTVAVISTVIADTLNGRENTARQRAIENNRWFDFIHPVRDRPRLFIVATILLLIDNYFSYYDYIFKICGRDL